MIDTYYRFAAGTPWRHVHNQLRRWKHWARYGVNCASMFQNVELEVNSLCNRTCSYCPNSFATRPAGYMDETLFRKIINELAGMKYDGNVTYHFYGEPLLDKRLPDFVEYTSRSLPNCSPRIYSNGDFLTLEIFREYLRRGLDFFLITQHDNRLPVHLKRILDEATDEEKKHIQIQFGSSLSLNNRSGLIISLGAPAEPLRAPCDSPLRSVVVTTEGNVVLCCNDYFETEVLGNLRTDSLRDVWCGERFEAFRRALSNGDRTMSKICASCDVVPSDFYLRRIVPQS